MRAERGKHVDPILLDLFLGSMDEAAAIRAHADNMTRPNSWTAMTQIHTTPHSDMRNRLAGVTGSVA